jgi:hypothetical protein
MKMQPKNIVSGPKKRLFTGVFAENGLFSSCFSTLRTLFQPNS